VLSGAGNAELSDQERDALAAIAGAGVVYGTDVSARSSSDPRSPDPIPPDGLTRKLTLTLQ
jgi:hypothetical protein